MALNGGKEACSPFQVITQSLSFANEHQSLWWDQVGPLWARVLQAAEYPLHEQYQWLLFLYGMLIPACGPYPQRFKSPLSAPGIPFDYSINFQECPSMPTVRIALEPITAASGTKDDPFNKAAPRDLINRLRRFGAAAGLDTEVYDLLIDECTPSPDECDMVKDYWRQDDVMKSTTLFGFDLKGGRISIKGYIYLLAKHLASKTPVEQLVCEPLIKLGKQLNCSEAMALVHEFMTESSSYNGYTVLSCDLTAKSRVKIYAFSTSISLKKLKGIWTLGGRVQNKDIAKGAELSLRLWEFLDLNEHEETVDFGFSADQGTDDRKFGAPFQWNYEVQPGNPCPVPKVYFPVDGMNDLHVAQAISRFFQSLGWTQRAESYPSLLQNLFPDEDISRSRSLQEWVSLAYSQKTGPYCTVYYRAAKSPVC